MIDQLVDLAVIDQAEQTAALYQLFEAECTEVGHPLSERQRLAWHKCLARQSDGTKHRLLGLFQVSNMVNSLGDDRRVRILGKLVEDLTPEERRYVKATAGQLSETKRDLLRREGLDLEGDDALARRDHGASDTAH